MRTILTAVGLLMTASSAQAAPPSAGDRAILEKLAADNDAAWNAKDAVGVSSQYFPGASLRLGDAPAFNGRDAIRDYFSKAFAARPAGFRHVTKLDHIDMVEPDMAFADAYVRVERENPDGSVTLMREYRNHSIAVRRGGKWWMRAVRAHPLPAKPVS